MAKKRTSPTDKIINVVLVLIILAVLGLGIYAVSGKVSEKLAQNNTGEDASQQQQEPQTIAKAAETKGLSVEQFISEYGLGAEVTGETLMADVYGTMTVANFAKFNDKSTEDFIAENKLPETVTGESLWQDAEPLIPVGIYMGGEESFNQIKQMYGLDESITADTPWGEVLPILEAKQAEMQAQAAASAAPQDETQAEATEAPAESPAAAE